MENNGLSSFEMMTNQLAEQADFVPETVPMQNSEIKTTGNEIEENQSDEKEIAEGIAELISPELVLLIIEGLIFLTAKAIQKFLKIEFDEKELEFTQKETKILKPILARWLKTLTISLSPAQAVLLSLGLIMLSKIMAIVVMKRLESGDSTPRERKANTDKPKRKYTPRKVKVKLGGN